MAAAETKLWVDIQRGTELPAALYEELGSSIKGDVYQQSNVNFVEYSVIFNGNVRTMAKAAVCPVDAEDVSKVVRFCNKYDLSLSVKAGGYGTAGFAVGGDIILDLNKLNRADIEPPRMDGSFTSLRVSVPGKGKGTETPTVQTGKRRREDDSRLRTYDDASPAVANFLAGPPLPPLPDATASRPRLANKQRTEDEDDTENVAIRDASVDPESSQSTSSNSDGGFSAFGAHSRASSNTTSPSPPNEKPVPMTSTSFGGDPFGYLSSAPTPVPSSNSGGGSNGFASGNFPPAPPPGATQSSYSSSINIMPGISSMTMFAMRPASQQNLTPARPVHPHAYVSFGSGMRQKEIDTFTATNALEGVDANGKTRSIPYHVPFSAHPVGSSIMLLGGFGFLGRLHGLSVDNLVEVEMVLADGSIIIVNKNEHPDLWWALRGAGSAFGVATRYKAIAYPVPVVYAGNLIYRFNAATAPSLIKHFRDCVKGAPRELYANVLLTAGPAGKDSLVVIQFCYIGSKDQGSEYLTAFLAWEGERCLLNEVDEKSFLHQQDSVAQVLRGKAGRQWFIRSTLVTSLPDDIINQTVMQFAGAPVGCTWLFELSGGAIADVQGSVLPKSQREATFTIAALHQWEMGVDDPRCIESAEEWIADTLSPVSTGGPYPSFLGRHESPARTMCAFGENWDRLVEVKKRYDPFNVFRNSFWPLDKHGVAVDPREREPPTP